MRKSAIIFSAVLLAGLTVSSGSASAAPAASPVAQPVAQAAIVHVAAAKPKKLGICVNRISGAMRMLEPNRPKRSQHGKCRSMERKTYMPTMDAIPAPFVLPAKIHVKVGVTAYVCTRNADVDGLPAYSCPLPVVPTPTPTVTVSPTPTTSGS